MELPKEITDRIHQLEDKYNSMGQSLESYLDGLLLSNYLTYWDYIQVDTLLTLQNPKTDFPDEEIFIMYHQITELYFKLSLWEIKQITEKPDIDAAFMAARLRRINAYFQNLTRSFAIMGEGMEPGQFLRFRLSLMPASGFQSAQYRMIEIASTDLINLVNRDFREQLLDKSIEEQYAYIYWKYGATILDTGKKTLTLRQFERKYEKTLIDWAYQYKENNLLKVYRRLNSGEQQSPELKEEMRSLDMMVNVNWPLVHYKSASHYLGRNATDVPATGGTNWQKYLPPRFQRRVFFPELWTDEELGEWGIRPSVKES